MKRGEVFVDPDSVPVLCHTTLLEKHEKNALDLKSLFRKFCVCPFPPTFSKMLLSLSPSLL